MGAFASEQDNLSTSIGLLPGTLENANATLASLNRAFPPTRAFAREILPGVNESAATIDASFPWVRETRKLLSQAELRGLAAGPGADDEVAGAADRRVAEAAARDQRHLPLRARRGAAHRRHRRAGLVRQRRAQLQGVLAGDGRARRREPELRRQRLLRALPGRRRHQHGRARRAGLDDRQARRVGAAPVLGVRPRYPGKRPPYNSSVPCYKSKIPNVNGPAGAGGPGEGTP